MVVPTLKCPHCLIMQLLMIKEIESNEDGEPAYQG